MKKKKKIYLYIIILIILFSKNVKALGTTKWNLLHNAAYNSENPFKGNLWGQCTWYAWGRMYERNGIKLPGKLGNAKDWYKNAPQEYKSTVLQENSILVIGGGSSTRNYGHVVYIEKIEGNIAYISEGNYDSSGTINGYREITKSIKNLYVGSNYYGKNGGVVEGYIVPNKLYKPNGIVQNLGEEFTAKIVPKYAPNYAITSKGIENGSKVFLQNQTNENNQKWKFIRKKDGAYSIINLATGLSLDIFGNGNQNNERIQTWYEKDGDKNNWYIYDYNDGYRLVARSSKKNMLSLDVPNNKYFNNQQLQIYEALHQHNQAQTFEINILPEKIQLNKSTLVLNLGKTETLFANLTPSKIKDKAISWISSNPNVATVLNGKITTLNAGSTVIIAKTSNGVIARCLLKVELGEIINLHIKKQRINTVTLNWNKVNKATGYVVYMSTNKNGPYKKVGGINKNNPTFTKGNLMLGQTYYFKVKAYTYINGKYYYGASKAISTTINIPSHSL